MSSQFLSIEGVGMTQFAKEHPDDLVTIASRAANRALEDAGKSKASVTSLHVGNTLGATHNEQLGLANIVCGALGLTNVSADTIDNTSASGASSILRAAEAVASGHSSVALVVGAEKMSGDTETVTEVISHLTHSQEYDHGITLPSFGGLAADAYLSRYDCDREALAHVGVKNHRHAIENEFAQFRSEISVADVLSSPIVASPLRLYDCCPLTDGAAAVVITDGNGPVDLRGIAGATGTHAVAERSDPLEIRSVREAGTGAFERAERKPTDIDVACIHDAFSILEWLELEELGFYNSGTAWKATVAGKNRRNGPTAVNPGGGLKARGHPLGATGVAQIVELYWHLTETATNRQVPDAKTGLGLNVAGFGNNAVCTVLEAK